LLFAAVMSSVVLALRPAPGDYNAHLQIGLEAVFGNTWRIVLGSMLAFWAGSFLNAYVLAKLKIWTQGKYLWSRTIGSTAVGELVDSSLFYVIAFYGIWPTEQVVHVAMVQYILKTSWEIVATPLTYAVVNFLKRRENEDYYDRHTHFNPFRIAVNR
jgi:uncharacterized integral membrane protein (TIGR00697 family)